MDKQLTKKCLLCNNPITHLLTFDDMPASAQYFPSAEALANERPIPLNLCQCSVCGLIQLDAEPVDYYKDVIRAGGTTSTMKQLRLEEYHRLLSFMNSKGTTSHHIVEIGCGCGEFIKMWDYLEEIKEDPDFSVSGIEHSGLFVEKAKASGLKVYEGFAENDYVIPGAPFDAFVQFNFLEHQSKPLEMLYCIRKNLKPHGFGLVTVPSFDYILQCGGYYELLRDHIAYYTKTTLRQLFESAGFIVHDERTVVGDTLEILVEKTALPDSFTHRFSGTLTDISVLEERYHSLNHSISRHIADLEAKGKTLAVWGASHEGLTIVSSTVLSTHIQYIIDSAPFKQGRFAPGSHVPVVSPDYYYAHPVDEIIIVAPSYTREIAQIIRERFGNQIKVFALLDGTIKEYIE